MSPIPRGSALKLVSVAQDLGAEALRGTLGQTEQGRLTIGHIEIESGYPAMPGRNWSWQSP